MEKVAKKILEEAEKERLRILKEAELEVHNIRQQTQAELDKLNEETEKLIHEAVEREKRRIVGMAKLAIRKEGLKTKREVIDYLFNEALHALINKEEYEYLDIIKRMLRLTGVKEGEIIIGREEQRIKHEFIKAVNDELGTNFILSDEHRDIQGGFILRRGKVEIDCSFKTLINTKRDKIELELARMVF